VGDNFIIDRLECDAVVVVLFIIIEIYVCRERLDFFERASSKSVAFIASVCNRFTVGVVDGEASFVSLELILSHSMIHRLSYLARRELSFNG
jgi:hypothetical protein